MNRFTSSDSNSIREDEQDEPLYYLAFQEPEDIICGGSDTEQTAEEVRQKRRRYAESARRYLAGHIPLIQSASLRGHLDRENGWINPWRYRPAISADWWQPGSEDMLFTRDNVMKRAAEHGLGYLTPKEALAWCKAAAETEARRELDQFDSMEATRSEGSDVNVEVESPTTSRSHAQSNPYSVEERRENPDDTDLRIAGFLYMWQRNSDESLVNTMKGTKRPAGSKWLKGSYVSKRARWNEPPVSSPTPLPIESNERDQRRHRSLARTPGPSNGQTDLITKPTTPWVHEAQRRDTTSRYSGSKAEGLELNTGGRDSRQQKKDVDGLQGNHQETPFVSASTFSSGSPKKTKRAQSIGRRPELGLDIMMGFSTMDRQANTPAAKSDTVESRRPGSGSNFLLKLSQKLVTRVDADSVEDESFTIEVVPSSRDLEKFQFRKKGRRSKKHQPREDREYFRLHIKETAQLAPGQAPADEAEEFPTRRHSLGELAQQLPLEMLNAEGHNVTEPSPAHSDDLEFTSTPKDRGGQQPELISPDRTSSRLDESYVKKIVTMPDNVLPNLDMNSPFAPFTPFEAMVFGSFGISHTTPSPPASRPAIVQGSPAATSLALNKDEPQVQSSALPAFQDVPRSPLDSAVGAGPQQDARLLHLPIVHDGPQFSDHQETVDAELLSRRISQSSNAPTKCIRARFQEAPQPIRTSAPDCDIMPLRSITSQEVQTSSEAISSKALPNSPEKLRATSKRIGKVKQRNQGASLFYDSTQSFNTTPPKSLRKSRLFLEAASNLADGKIIKDDEVAEMRNTDEAPLFIHENAITEGPSADVQPTGTADLLQEQAQDEMDVQGPISKHCQSLESNSSVQTENDRSSQSSVGAANTELEPGRTTLLAPEEEEAPSADEEQEIWAGCGPQSPWAVEDHLPQPTSKTDQLVGPSLTAERGTGLGRKGSTPLLVSDLASDWQPVERPLTPDHVDFRAFRDLMSSTPSPGLEEAHAEHDVVSSTQLLIEIATSNPWRSNTKGHASIKAKKRVSFGVLPAEEKADSQPGMSSTLRKRPGSPPPPESTSQHYHGDAFEDSPIAIGIFRNHFTVAGGLRHLVPTGSQVLRSPAVGAMADRFIAADRETSTDLERQAGLIESPTRQSRPKSDARTNRSPSEATDDDVEVNLDKFINDASSFLEDWSVDSEVKKTRGLKGTKESKSSQSARRSLFSLRNVWTS